MCISLELGSYQGKPVTLHIEEHTRTKHSQYQFKDTQKLMLVLGTT